MDNRRLEDDQIEDMFEEWSDYDMTSDESSSSEDEGEHSEAEEDEERIPDHPEIWSETPNNPMPFLFLGSPGVNDSNMSRENILGIFESFFSDDLLLKIVAETNRYAQQHISKNIGTLTSRSIVHKWVDTNLNELKTYFGILILQGICQKPTNELYFTKRESIATPFFSKIISIERFSLLSKFLHFSNNEDLSSLENIPNRKLAKIYPVLNHLREKFKSLYTPKKCISIDESLLGWKGRLGYKQYIPSKRKRFGIKFYQLCESETGYIYNFICYTGASTAYPHTPEDMPMTEKVVFSLAHDLLDRGYCLYMDNYYNSVALTEKLILRETDVVGTMRINRKGIPSELKSKKLKKGELVALFREKQTIIKWKDKKDVLLISTIHGSETEQVTVQGGKVVDKPTAVIDYNKFMGGVDVADSHLHFYSVSRNRLKKYYMKMFRHFFDMTCFNSYVIYKNLGGKEKRVSFMTNLGESLISKYMVPRGEIINRPSKIPKLSRYVERHFPDTIPPTTKAKPTKRCVVCWKNGTRKESRVWCVDCEVGLCPAPCFKIYHTVVV